MTQMPKDRKDLKSVFRQDQIDDSKMDFLKGGDGPGDGDGDQGSDPPWNP